MTAVTAASAGVHATTAAARTSCVHGLRAALMVPTICRARGMAEISVSNGEGCVRGQGLSSPRLGTGVLAVTTY
eukprot:scaffold273793_cov23-Tisochrysis_lutea.AAC.1